MKVIAEVVKGGDLEEEEGRKLMEKKKKEENYERSRKWFPVLKLSKLKKMLMICYAPKPPSKRPQTTTPNTDKDTSTSSSSSPTTKSNFLDSNPPPIVPHSDSDPSIFETGESSNTSSSFVCEICVEPKPANESFSIKGCSHDAYCTDCITKYVAYNLQENVSRIGCPVPGCGGYLEPEYCRPILPPEVLDRWGKALCEAVEKFFYCPFKDCSSIILSIEDDRKKVVTESECPNCRRLLCAKCEVAWHSGIVCSKFQKLNKNERENEDIMLMNLAQKKRWGRCPNCRFYVEKTTGCNSVKCRCGRRFNYRGGY